MLVPLKIAGLALAGRTFLSKSGFNPFTKKVKTLTKPNSRPVHTGNNPIPAQNPLLTLVRGLSGSLSGLTASISKIMKKTPGEDYNTIIKRFLPENHELLKPQYPRNSEKYQVADFDDDSENELVASYRLNDEIRTVILKRYGKQWAKIGEISNKNYESLNYAGFADITGEGRKQLLLGLKNKGQPGQLYGYSLQNGSISTLFTQKYNRFEILDCTDSDNRLKKTGISIWNNGPVLDNIEFKYWNGCELEPAGPQNDYYSKRVLPYYAQKAKQSPRNPSNWYKLADAMSKAGFHRDGLIAADIGIGLNPEVPSKEDFLQLKDSIKSSMKH
ncbi:MAG: hypothetical protein N3I35_01765 [Clostridia bacterium]|nr:hypothetical protein [Clostridia bacterium]